MQEPIIFISGIDTNIGKTIATGFLARELGAQGKKVITQKFVQTGGQGLSEDIQLHRKIQGIPLTDFDYAKTTCPYHFAYPCSPHLAASLAGKTIDTNIIDQATATLAKHYDHVLIEGAGGLAVPYKEGKTTLDFIVERNYPLILITNGKLGSLNHTLLSIDACLKRNIRILRLIYNRHQSLDPIIDTDSQSYLKRQLKQLCPDAEFSYLDSLEV